MSLTPQVGLQLILGCFVSLMMYGCTSVALSTVERKPLPAEPPSIKEFPLEMFLEDGIRRPVVSTPSSGITLDVPFTTMANESEFELRGVAEIHARVRRQLGTRFAFIGSDHIEQDRCPQSRAPSKGGNPSISQQSLQSGEPIRQLTYYSYSKNLAFVVCIAGLHVIAVGPHPVEDYQPVEGEEEFENAVKLARQDARLSNFVQGLTGHAILTVPDTDRLLGIFGGAGDRMFWVTFTKDNGPTLFQARVNLTTQEILEAGPGQGPQSKSE